jgi:hypothetical protein
LCGHNHMKKFFLVHMFFCFFVFFFYNTCSFEILVFIQKFILFIFWSICWGMREKIVRKQNMREKVISLAYFDNKKKSFLVLTGYIWQEKFQWCVFFTLHLAKKVDRYWKRICIFFLFYKLEVFWFKRLVYWYYKNDY